MHKVHQKSTAMKKFENNIRLILTALCISVAVLVISLAWIFNHAVSDTSWRKSIETITDMSKQQALGLISQLELSYNTMHLAKDELLKANNKQMAQNAMAMYHSVDPRFLMYFTDGSVGPSWAKPDDKVMSMLAKTNRDEGILDPHVSSVKGINVYDIYVWVTLLDGSKAALIKEYEVSAINRNYSFSFFGNKGVSYLINTEGSILFRPQEASDQSIDNFFDLIGEDPKEDVASQLSTALSTGKTGWAVIKLNGVDNFIAYRPIGQGSSWALISAVPVSEMLATSQSVRSFMLFIQSGVAVLFLLLSFFFYRKFTKINNTASKRKEYIDYLFNSVNEGLALVTNKEPYCYVRTNDIGLKLLGIKKEEQRDPKHELILANMVIDDDRERVLNAFYQLKQSAQNQKVECRIRKSDGVIVWMDFCLSSFVNIEGQEFILLSFHDVTAAKRIVEQHDRQGRKDRQILMSALAKGCALIAQLNFETGNLHIMFMQDADKTNMQNTCKYDNVYKHFLSRMKSPYQVEFSNLFAPEKIRLLASSPNKTIVCEAECLFSDNHYHWMSLQLITVATIDGNNAAVFLIKLIDDKKTAERNQRQALLDALSSTRAATASKSRFLSNMSHDIRTPLNSILGMSALLSEHPENKDQVLSGVKKISMAGQHLLSLVSDIVDMAKIEGGKIAIEEEPFNITEFLSETLDLIRPQALAGNLSLEVNLSGIKAENVIGDKLRLRQVILNILTNAVKYTNSGGFVRFDVVDLPNTHEGMRTYVFTCTDSGIGMSEDFQKHIFEPFERERNSADALSMGSGLGMAITSNLVRLMNGRISVKSKLNHGSTFIIEMPMVVEESGAIEELDYKWRGLRALVIDDDENICREICDALRQLGLRAEFSTNATKAVQFAVSQKRSDPFGLLLVDWNMHQANDGIDITRKLREQIDFDVPIIMLTAHDFSTIDSTARRAGVTSLMSKPFYRSKFCYTLNALDRSPKDMKAEQLYAKEHFNNKRILLVEDNELNREIAKAMLCEKGIAVEIARNGKEALDLFASSPQGYYDLIFMDVQMPVMNGYDTTKAIRNLERDEAKSIPIVAMTANAFADDVNDAQKAGMNEHFSKPIDPKSLDRLLHRYLGSN